MRIVLTGATGLLGSHVLYELLKRHLGRLESLEIVLLGRRGGFPCLRTRIEAMLAAELADYVGRPLAAWEHEWVSKHLRPVDFELGPEPEPVGEAERVLQEEPIDFFLHVAGLTDFRGAERLEATNVLGSQRLQDLLSRTRIHRLGFVSTAYAGRSRSRAIAPGDLDLEADFRNDYERSKAISEFSWRRFARERGLPLCVYRPAVIGGRLIEGPRGHTTKFDVFYGWGAWFARQKMRQLPSDDAFGESMQLKLRVHAHPASDLNIVPVDYAAKLIVSSMESDRGSQDYNIAHDRGVPQRAWMGAILDSLAIRGVRFVDREPPRKSALEKAYYRTIGDLYRPYVAAPSVAFDCTSRRALDRSAQLRCPEIDHGTFRDLVDFAARRRFGLASAARVLSAG